MLKMLIILIIIVNHEIDWFQWKLGMCFRNTPFKYAVSSVLAPLNFSGRSAWIKVSALCWKERGIFTIRKSLRTYSVWKSQRCVQSVVQRVGNNKERLPVQVSLIDVGMVQPIIGIQFEVVQIGYLIVHWWRGKYT